MEKSHDLLWTEFDEQLNNLVNNAKISVKAKRTSIQSIYNQLLAGEKHIIADERKALEEGANKDGIQRSE